MQVMAVIWEGRREAVIEAFCFQLLFSRFLWEDEASAFLSGFSVASELDAAESGADSTSEDRLID